MEKVQYFKYIKGLVHMANHVIGMQNFLVPSSIYLRGFGSIFKVSITLSYLYNQLTIICHLQTSGIMQKLEK